MKDDTYAKLRDKLKYPSVYEETPILSVLLELLDYLDKKENNLSFITCDPGNVIKPQSNEIYYKDLMTPILEKFLEDYEVQTLLQHLGLAEGLLKLWKEWKFDVLD